MDEEFDSPEWLIELARANKERPPWIRPMGIALESFAERLNDTERRVLVLGSASRLAPFIDPAVDLVAKLGLGRPNSFTFAVDALFVQLLSGERIVEIPLLERYKAQVATGELDVAHGGQGNSLVEEVLAPAMLLLGALVSEDGLKVISVDEDNIPIVGTWFGYSFHVCRIANDLIHVGRPPQHDVGGIPPWLAEAAEKDSIWYSMELLSQTATNRDGALEKVEHYSRKCRIQNLQLAEKSMERYRTELCANWPNV